MGLVILWETKLGPRGSNCYLWSDDRDHAFGGMLPIATSLGAT